uniref:MARVEL domain-containing protein n=1 Tax=Steinernema glaseri TaxID=37863 RepID=A0A1I7ZQD8_9BILA
MGTSRTPATNQGKEPTSQDLIKHTTNPDEVPQKKSRKLFIFLRVSAFILILITMYLILAAPSFNSCLVASGYGRRGSGCVNSGYRMDVSRWADHFGAHIWLQIVIFGLPLFLSIFSLRALNGEMDINKEIKWIRIASIVSFVCGVVEIWFASGLAQFSTSVGGFSMRSYGRVDGWWAAVVCLLISGTAYAIDVSQLKKGRKNEVGECFA